MIRPEELSINEIWKDVDGFEGIYQVSNLGRVKSFWSKNKNILKPYKDHEGYYQVKLVRYSGAKSKNKRIHRLVAIAFIPNPENKPTVNHKKGIKLDNRVNELEWATYSENHLHAYRIGLKKPYQRKQRGSDNLLCKPVIQYAQNNEFIDRHQSQIDAEIKTGIKNYNISSVCRGRNKTAGGYLWRFEKD